MQINSKEWENNHKEKQNQPFSVGVGYLHYSMCLCLGPIFSQSVTRTPIRRVLSFHEICKHFV